jgi:LAO/AO transport system kinase
LHILTDATPEWHPPVLTISGLTNGGLDLLWAKIDAHRAALMASGQFHERRRAQAVRWVRAMLQDALFSALQNTPSIVARLPQLEDAVRQGRTTPQSAVSEIMGLFGRRDRT